jgi:predicted RNase H-like HicB family nuclease
MNCHSLFRETPERALKELEIAVELWLEVAEKDNSEIPEPSQMAAFE